MDATAERVPGNTSPAVEAQRARKGLQHGHARGEGSAALCSGMQSSRTGLQSFRTNASPRVGSCDRPDKRADQHPKPERTLSKGTLRKGRHRQTLSRRGADSPARPGSRALGNDDAHTGAGRARPGQARAALGHPHHQDHVAAVLLQDEPGPRGPATAECSLLQGHLFRVLCAVWEVLRVLLGLSGGFQVALRLFTWPAVLRIVRLR